MIFEPFLYVRVMRHNLNQNFSTFTSIYSFCLQGHLDLISYCFTPEIILDSVLILYCFGMSFTLVYTRIKFMSRVFLLSQNYLHIFCSIHNSHHIQLVIRNAFRARDLVLFQYAFQSFPMVSLKPENSNSVTSTRCIFCVSIYLSEPHVYLIIEGISTHI